MEIKLSIGDTIQVPAGCKATIKENTIVIEEDAKAIRAIFEKRKKVIQD